MSAHSSLVGQVTTQLFYSNRNLSSSGVLFLDLAGLYDSQSQTCKRTRGRLGVASGGRINRGTGLSANTLTALSPVRAVLDPQLIGIGSLSSPNSKRQLKVPFSPQPQPHPKGITACNSSLKICGNSASNRGINGKFTVLAHSPAVETSVVDHDVKLVHASNPGWEEFTKNVSGEWDGFAADFTMEGRPIELPWSVVPEAYREWEVKVFDWQTQCPTLAQPEPNFDLTYKVIRLLPTVGCEADAATRYSIEERCISNANAFAYRSNGCYVAVWPIGKNIVELEHCLVDSRDKESRVRIIQVLKVDNNSSPPVELQKITVFKEQWYGPFRNGDQLGGCSIRDSAFASTTALDSLQVSGVWQGLNATTGLFHSHESIAQELVDESGPRKSFRDASGLVLLPKQLWCSLDNKTDKDEGETCCEVGWLLEEGVAVTSKCLFSWDPDFSLKEITIAYENIVLVHAEGSGTNSANGPIQLAINQHET